MGQYFRYLRKIPWIPGFKWVSTVEEAADTINRPHEDYPYRVGDTKEAIEESQEFTDYISPCIEISYLQGIHYQVFGNESHGGQFRTVNVRIGDYIPPKFDTIYSMMEQLVLLTGTRLDHSNKVAVFADRGRNISYIENLVDWYTDFETIHPFEDGNGRVGGIIIALFSYKWFPEKGYLVPCQ